MMSAMTDTVGIRKEFGQPFDAVNYEYSRVGKSNSFTVDLRMLRGIL